MMLCSVCIMLGMLWLVLVCLVMVYRVCCRCLVSVRCEIVLYSCVVFVSWCRCEVMMCFS